MEIQKNTVASLVYELRKENATGEIIEKIEKANALEFVYGSGNLLKDFESNLAGLKKGENFEFALTSAQAYGEYNKEAKVEMPLDTFKDDKGNINDKMLVIGGYVPMQDAQGNMYNGKVLEIGKEKVSLDFNHPLAGMDLFFSGEVTDVREATEKELEKGHIHKGDGECSDGACGCGN